MTFCRWFLSTTFIPLTLVYFPAKLTWKLPLKQQHPCLNRSASIYTDGVYSSLGNGCMAIDDCTDLGVSFVLTNIHAAIHGILLSVCVVGTRYRMLLDVMIYQPLFRPYSVALKAPDSWRRELLLSHRIGIQDGAV